MKNRSTKGRRLEIMSQTSWIEDLEKDDNVKAILNLLILILVLFILWILLRPLFR